MKKILKRVALVLLWIIAIPVLFVTLANHNFWWHVVPVGFLIDISGFIYAVHKLSDCPSQS